MENKFKIWLLTFSAAPIYQKDKFPGSIL